MQMVYYMLQTQPYHFIGVLCHLFHSIVYAMAYFLSIAEHFVTQISPEFSALFIYKFLTPVFQGQCLGTCQTQRLIFHGGSVVS